MVQKCYVLNIFLGLVTFTTVVVYMHKTTVQTATALSRDWVNWIGISAQQKSSGRTAEIWGDDATPLITGCPTKPRAKIITMSFPPYEGVTKAGKLWAGKEENWIAAGPPDSANWQETMRKNITARTGLEFTIVSLYALLSQVERTFCSFPATWVGRPLHPGCTE